MDISRASTVHAVDPVDVDEHDQCRLLAVASCIYDLSKSTATVMMMMMMSAAGLECGDAAPAVCENERQ